MVPIRHVACDQIGFYVFNIPVGRKIEAFDSCNELGTPNAQGKLVICRKCKEPIDLEEVNNYYGLE